MKALVLIIVLVSISSTFSFSLRMKNHAYRAHQISPSVRASEQNSAHKIAKLASIIDDLDRLINDPEANKAFFEDFFKKYDVDGTEGLSREEFYQGLNEWTSNNGFGEQLTIGPDALFNKLDKDHSGSLSFDEVFEGSGEIFSWYRNMAQNRLFNATNELSEQLKATRCQDVKESVASIYDPAVREETVKLLDTDNSGTLSREEIEPLLAHANSQYSVPRLSESEDEEIFNKYADENGEVSTEDAYNFFEEYTDKIVANICGGGRH